MESTKDTTGDVLIAHIADVHLRHTQYATSRRGVDFFDAFMRAVEAAAKDKRHPDCIVVAGDIFDNSRPGALIIGQLMRVDAKAKALGIPVLAGTGNHDYSTPTWLSTLFPDSDIAVGGIIPIDGKITTINDVKICGIPPYSTTAFRESLAEIDALASEADVVIYHNLISGITPLYVGEKNVLDVSELPLYPRTKAILLGDIHIQQYIYRSKAGGDSCLIGYPGSLEMCSASESTEKSIPLIRVNSSGAVVEGHIPLSIRAFVTAKVADSPALDALVEKVKAVASQHPLVLVDFDRSLTQTVGRLHALLDTTQAVLRCTPLPSTELHKKREIGGDGDRLTMGFFVAKRFESRPDLAVWAEALLTRGDVDAANIITAFIDQREAEITKASE